jgi:hypothetical protein
MAETMLCRIKIIALEQQKQCSCVSGAMLWNIESNALIDRENAYRSVN